MYTQMNSKNGIFASCGLDVLSQNNRQIVVLWRLFRGKKSRMSAYKKPILESICVYKHLYIKDA